MSPDHFSITTKDEFGQRRSAIIWALCLQLAQGHAALAAMQSTQTSTLTRLGSCTHGICSQPLPGTGNHWCGTESAHLGSASCTSTRILSSCAAVRASRRLQRQEHSMSGAHPQLVTRKRDNAYGKTSTGPRLLNAVQCKLNATQADCGARHTSCASQNSSSKGRSAPQRTARCWTQVR